MKECRGGKGWHGLGQAKAAVDECSTTANMYQQFVVHSFERRERRKNTEEREAVIIHGMTDAECRSISYAVSCSGARLRPHYFLVEGRKETLRTFW